MPASAINIRHIFHRRASSAAIFAVRIGLATAVWMSTFLCVVHLNCLLFQKSELDRKSFAFDSTRLFDAESMTAVALVVQPS
jgi:hypothetical protein